MRQDSLHTDRKHQPTRFRTPVPRIFPGTAQNAVEFGNWWAWVRVGIAQRQQLLDCGGKVFDHREWPVRVDEGDSWMQ